MRRLDPEWRGRLVDWVPVAPSQALRGLLMAAAARALEDERSEIDVRDVLAVIHDQTTAPLVVDVGVDGATACERSIASARPSSHRRRPPKADRQARLLGVWMDFPYANDGGCGAALLSGAALVMLGIVSRRCAVVGSRRARAVSLISRDDAVSAREAPGTSTSARAQNAR